MMAHQSKSKSKRPPRSYLPPRQNSLHSSLRGGSDFQLISPLSDLSNPSFSAFHRRSRRNNVEEEELTPDRHVLVIENVPHPDRISKQRTHVLPNDAADIDKRNKSKTKLIKEAFKGCFNGGVYRLDKMPEQTTKAVRYTWSAVVNAVSNRVHTKTEEETLNVVVETSGKENAPKMDEKNNTLGLLTNTKDSFFESLWRESKGSQQDLETKTPIVALNKAFEDAYGLHREDDYFNRIAASGGSPCTKPSFSLMLTELSPRDTSVAVPPAMEESFMSVYIEEPTKEVIELTDSALTKHDENVDSSFHVTNNKLECALETKPRASSSADKLIYSPDDATEESIMSRYTEEPSQDNKNVSSTEDSSMDQFIYQYSFHPSLVQSESSVTNISASDGSPCAKPSFSRMLTDISTNDTSVAVPPAVEESFMSVYIEGPTEEGIELTDSALKKHGSIDSSFHVTNNKIEYAPEIKPRASSSTDKLVYSPDGAVEERIMSCYIEESSQDNKNVSSKEDPSMDQFTHQYSFQPSVAQSESNVTDISEGNSPFQLMGELHSFTSSPSEDSQSVLNSEDRASMINMPAYRKSLSSQRESEDIVSIVSETTTETLATEHQDRKVSLESSSPKSAASQKEMEEVVSVVSDTINESEATEVSERNVRKLSLESEHQESFPCASTVSDMMSQTPTAALHDHQDRKVSATVSPSSAHESENLHLTSMEETSKELMPELLEELADDKASPSQPNDFVREMETAKHEPTESDGQFRRADLASRSMDDAESFSSEFMSLKVTESAPSVLETIDFNSVVHASPEIVKHSQRKSAFGLMTPSIDCKRIATCTSDQREEDGIVGFNLESSFLAPIPYSPSDDSVASSTGSPVPLVSNQALSNAAFLFSPSFAGEEIKLLTRANSPQMMNLSTFAINTAQSRSRLSTFSARSRPAFSIPISSAPDNMSSIRPLRCSYVNDDFTYSRREGRPSNEGRQKHVHFPNSNECFVIREANKARVAMGTPLKVDSPVIESMLSDLSDTGIIFATSTASDPSPSLLRGSYEDCSLQTNELDNAQEDKAGDGDLDLLQEDKKDDSVDDDLQEDKKDSSVMESTPQDTSNWSYREENGVHCAATPLRANGRSVQNRPSCIAPANSPMIRFREAKRKFSSKPVAKVPTRKSSPMKFAKPNHGGPVHSRVTELNDRLRSNRQLVRKNSRRETGGQNVIAPRSATLVAPLFRNPVTMSNRDGDTSKPKYSIESQVNYEERSDSGVSTVASGEYNVERKPKYSIDSLSMCEGTSDTGVSVVASGEYEVECNIDVSTIVSDEDKDIFRKMMGSPQELSSESEDEDDAFAEVMKNSSPLFDDHKLGRTSGSSLQSLLSRYENNSRNQQPPRPNISRGHIGSSLRSIVSEDPSALTFDTNKENSSFGPRTLSFTDKAKVNPREQQQHHAHPGALCLSPLQRTPMQARKWRALAAAAKEKDRSKKGSSKKGSSKKQLGLRERNSNAIY